MLKYLVIVLCLLRLETYAQSAGVSTVFDAIIPAPGFCINQLKIVTTAYGGWGRWHQADTIQFNSFGGWLNCSKRKAFYRAYNKANERPTYLDSLVTDCVTYQISQDSISYLFEQLRKYSNNFHLSDSGQVYFFKLVEIGRSPHKSSRISCSDCNRFRIKIEAETSTGIAGLEYGFSPISSNWIENANLEGLIEWLLAAKLVRMLIPQNQLFNTQFRKEEIAMAAARLK